MSKDAMKFLIGIDEAGYAPNLGPLVIGASVWQIPLSCRADRLYEHLRRCVAAEPNPRDPRVTIADSKTLYSSASGLARLERSVLAALGVLDDPPATWRQLWPRLDPRIIAQNEPVPWHGDFDCPVPLEAEAADIAADRRLLSEGLQQAEVQLLAVRGLALFPAQFNALTEAWGNKSEVLSRLSLQLVAALLADLPNGPAEVFCDRHGGRMRYRPLLQQQFYDGLVEVRRESAAESVYRFGPVERRVEVGFRVGGESILATALASMTAKYLREAAMHAFNVFWRQRLPDLHPTAGYPLDARRFKQSISPLQAELGISDEVLWRNR